LIRTVFDRYGVGKGRRRKKGYGGLYVMLEVSLMGEKASV